MVAHVQEGDVIGHATCDGCGRDVPIKVTKGRCAKYYCAAVVGERDGKKERCFTFTQWGRVAAARMIEQFEKGENHDTSENREEPPACSSGGNDDGAGDNAGNSGGGIGAALKHFLTG